MVKKDEELMLEYRNGSLDALEEIFQRYKKKTLNYSLRLLHNLADAEDVVSETFATLTARKDIYIPKAKFSTWLYTIVHNLSVDRLRSRNKTIFMWVKKKPEAGQVNGYEELQIQDTRPLADETLEKEEMTAYVKQAVKKLPATYRAALVLREYQKLSYEEIAVILQCSLDKVKVLIYRARERVKKEILPLIREAQ